MRVVFIGAIAAVALASASAIAIAQSSGGAEPSGKMQGPQGGGSQGPAMNQPGGHNQGAGKGEAQRSTDDGHGKGVREGESAPRKGQPKAAESEHEKSLPKASQNQSEKGQPKASERQPEKSQPKATERQPEKGQPKSSQNQQDHGQKSSQAPQAGKQPGHVQVSEQQRTGVRDRLMKEGKFTKTKVNIHVTVGARIPRSVRLLALPVAIIELAPSYRGYDYIVLEDDTICIVDPRSYAVIDVLPAGSQRAEGPHGQHLTLSNDQMRFIYSALPKEPRANVHVRLALGAEVPRDVELLPFPRDVVSRIPDLDGYGYVIADRDVVIVDTRERGVALVINE
jgi:uncharacterized DUF497 family protein